MTQFYADHEAIRSFATRVGDHVGGVSEAASYAQTWVHVPDTADGQVFRNFIGTAREVESAIASVLSTLRAVCEASGAELDATARFYRDTDSAVAAGLDAKQGSLPSYSAGRRTHPGALQAR